MEQGGQGEGFEARPYPLHVDGRRRVDERPEESGSAMGRVTAREREGEGEREGPAGLAGPHCALRPSQSGLFHFLFPFLFFLSLFAN